MILHTKNVAATNITLESFSTYIMQAEPSKCQFIVFESELHQRNTQIRWKMLK